MGSTRQEITNEDLTLIDIEEENKRLRRELEKAKQSNELHEELNYKLITRADGLQTQIALLQELNQQHESNEIVYLKNIDLLQKENGLLKIKNTELLNYAQHSVNVEEEQLLFSESLFMDYTSLMMQGENDKLYITDIKNQIASLINLKGEVAVLKGEVHKQQKVAEEDSSIKEAQIKNQIEAAFKQLFQSDFFDKLTKKIEDKFSRQFEQQLDKIFSELQTLEKNQDQFQSEHAPILQKHKIKQAQLLEQSALLSDEKTKLFYRTLYKRLASKLAATIVLYSDLIEYAARLANKFGKFSGAVLGSLFDSAPGGSIIGSIVSFGIEEGVSAVKGKFQERKTRITMDSLPDPKEAIPVAELIARRLTQAYAETILKTPSDEIQDLAESCSRTIYNFFKHGKLAKYEDTFAEEKVKMIVNHVREEKIIEENKMSELDCDLSTLELMRPIQLASLSSDNKQVRERMVSVANKAESARTLSEMSNRSSNARIEALQRAMNEQQIKHDNDIARMEKMIKDQDEKHKQELQVVVGRKIDPTNPDKSEKRKSGIFRFGSNS